MASRKRLNSPEQYTVAWIAALSHERAAATAVLDEEHERPTNFEQHQHDTNAYTWGGVGHHNIVIASLPSGEYGSTAATTTATSLRFSLPHIRFGLMVGIGAGLPQLEHGEDVRLGDVVVSQPQESSGGVVQYDLVKAKEGNHFLTGHLAMPPEVLRKALGKLQAEHELRDSAVPAILEAMLLRFPKMGKRTPKNPGYVYQGVENDRLFAASSQHVGKADCRNCQESEKISRDRRDSTHPEIHYGIVASGNTLVKNAIEREEILERLPEEVRNKCFCIEMEAAGLMNSFPCIVIRGICDYGDAHKNNMWQRYAAATAAAFAKEFLGFVDAEEVKREPELRHLVRSIGNKVEEHHLTSMETKRLVETSAELTRLDKIHRLLSPPLPSFNHERALEQRQEGTGRWFIESQSFESFKQGRVPFLWLYGIPGCGKTILCSTIIQDLGQHLPDPTSPVLYFYFDFNDGRKRTIDAVLRSFLWQLIQNTGSSKQEEKQLLDLSSCPSVQILAEMLGRVLRRLGRVRMVLDALDECQTRLSLLPWLAALARQPNLHIVVTSRREYDIESEFQKWLQASACISLNQREVNVDIGSYVSARLQTDSELQRWRGNHKVQAEIIRIMTQKAGGMFRWATCQLDALAECLDYPQLTEALSSLPTTLAETYTRIIDQIPTRYRAHAMRIFQILTWSHRPLDVAEAVDFLVVDLNSEPGFDKKNRMPIPKEIVKLCSSLVTIGPAHHDVPRSFAGMRVGSLEALQLAHFSVREYFMSDDLDERYRQHVGKIPAAVCIASVSLTYLLQLDHSLGVKEIRSQFPLALFAALNWTRFAREVDTEYDVVKRLTLRLLGTHGSFKTWLAFRAQRYSDPIGSSWVFFDGNFVRVLPVPLYYASLEGLYGATETLVAQGADVNAQHGDYGNVLQAACQGGHEKVARLLLDRGANVDTQGGYYGNALQAASRGGCNITIAQLLDRGVDVNARGGYHGCALLAACKADRESTVAILLERGADANTSIDNHDTALWIAYSRGKKNYVKLLLNWGAKDNVQRGPHVSVLQEVSFEGKREMAEILIENGVDINTRGGRYNTALYAACYSGHEGLVRMFLEKGAHVNVQGGAYGNALQAACFEGHDTIVAILLENGADVNAQGGHFGNALQVASFGGYKKIVDLLLRSGADVNAEGGHYRSALRAAHYEGRKDVEDLLLEKGAKPIARGEY